MRMGIAAMVCIESRGIAYRSRYRRDGCELRLLLVRGTEASSTANCSCSAPWQWTVCRVNWRPCYRRRGPKPLTAGGRGRRRKIASSWVESERPNRQGPRRSSAKSSSAARRWMGFDICRQSWLAPWISQFSWLFQETLHAAAMTPGDVEDGVRHPHESPKFQAFLSHLVLGSREERRLLKTNESFPLRDMFHLVDLRYADISPGDSSTTPFAESDIKRRAHIVYAVCHHAEQTDEFIEALRSIEPSDARVEPFAFDRHRNQYYHFGNDDGRVYRQAAPTKNEPDGRFELVCDGVQSTLSFIKTLDRTNPAERELREQLQILLPDLIAVEEREVRRSQKKATMSSVSQPAAARPHSIRQSRVERELARQEEERLEQEELARKRAERANELSEMSSALIRELSRRTAARSGRV